MDRIKELLATLQAKKDPLESMRCALWAQLDVMVRDGAPAVAEQSLREEIKEVQALVAPIDALMVEVARAKNVKDKAILTGILDAVEARL